MYEEFWRAVTTAPVPSHLPPAAQVEYRAQLADLLKPLVRNAIRYWEATELSIERAGIETPWGQKIREELVRVRQLLLEEPSPTGGSAPSSTSQSAPNRSPLPTPLSSPERSVESLRGRAAPAPPANPDTPVSDAAATVPRPSAQ
jgi:hypothetical protein